MKLIKVALLLGIVSASPTVFLQENECYMCLTQVSNVTKTTGIMKYCTLDELDPETDLKTSTSKCCDVRDPDRVCVNPSSKCITPYRGPPAMVKDQYNLTHPRESPFDHLLNVYRCGWQTPFKNGCNQQELILPSLRHFRNFLITNNTRDVFDRPIQNPQYDEICFYNNTFTRKPGENIDLQVKQYDASDDYLIYVWYSNERDPRGERVTNVIGTFQLNNSSPIKQQGFHTSEEMALYIIVIRNATLAREVNNRKTYAGIQINLIGESSYTNSKDDEPQEETAPFILIIVAVSVGGFISSICIGVLIYIAIKTIRHRGLQGLQKPPSHTDTEDEDRLSYLTGNNSQQRSGPILRDSLSNESSMGEGQPTIKVLPAGGTSYRNREELMKQNLADNVLGYNADHSDHDGPGAGLNQMVRGGRFKDLDNVQDYYMGASNQAARINQQTPFSGLANPKHSQRSQGRESQRREASKIASPQQDPESSQLYDDPDASRMKLHNNSYLVQNQDVSFSDGNPGQPGQIHSMRRSFEDAADDEQEDEDRYDIHQDPERHGDQQVQGEDYETRSPDTKYTEANDTFMHTETKLGVVEQVNLSGKMREAERRFHGAIQNSDLMVEDIDEEEKEY